MHVARVDVYGYDLTLRPRRVRRCRAGARSSACRARSCASTADDGTQGFGETCPLGPAYLPAHGDGARAALRELVAGAARASTRASSAIVNDALDGALLGHAYAKSAVDIACWDLLGKATGLPVCDAARRSPAGRRTRSTSRSRSARPRQMAAHVRARRAEGIHHFQLKLGADPHEDAARVRAVLEATSGEDVVIADANGGWRLQDAVVAARAAGGPRPRVLRAAVPDARGVPLRAPAHDAADGARRGDHRCPGVPARISRGRHGGDQPQDLAGSAASRARARSASSPRRSASGSRSRTPGAATS